MRMLSSFTAMLAAAPAPAIPRTVKTADNVYTYEDYHAGDEQFTTTNMFVVMDGGVLVADRQGSPVATKGLIDAIAKVALRPIKYVVVYSDHGDHTGGNVSFPSGITYVIHPASRATLERRPNGWKPLSNAQVVADKLPLKLGGEDVEIVFLGRAHTGGDLSVFLPRQRSCFCARRFSAASSPRCDRRIHANG